MGHVWKNEGGLAIAVKGSAENVLDLCGLNEEQYKLAEQKTLAMSRQGLRVIAVAEQNIPDGGKAPETIHDCKLTLRGLVGLADPPRDSVKEDIRECVRAGIRVVMITGDNGITAVLSLNK